MSEVADPLEELPDFREAARRIIRDPSLNTKNTCMGLLNLVERTKTASMPEWARQAVYEEAREFLGVGPVGPEVPGDAVEVAARTLRAKGYRCCPTCARELHSELDFRRWADMRRIEAENALRRERAVSAS